MRRAGLSTCVLLLCRNRALEIPRIAAVVVSSVVFPSSTSLQLLAWDHRIFPLVTSFLTLSSLVSSFEGVVTIELRCLGLCFSNKVYKAFAALSTPAIVGWFVRIKGFPWSCNKGSFRSDVIFDLFVVYFFFFSSSA